MKMDKDWQKIYSSVYEHKVEIVKAVLKDMDIDSVIINKKDSAYLFGELELYVQADHVIRAKRIINEETL
jgi:cytidylate kinase